MQMRAVIAQKNPLQTSIVEVPCPVPDADEVLVQVRAAALMPLDWDIVQGTLNFQNALLRPGRRALLGLEFSGDVVSGTGRFKAGARVYGATHLLWGHNTLATHVVAKNSHIGSLPPNLSYSQAASIGISAVVGYRSVYAPGKVKAGDTVLVTGAGGAMGSLTAQLARCRGAQVTGLCSSQQAERIRSLGITPMAYDDPHHEELLGEYDLIVDFAQRYHAPMAHGHLRRGGLWVPANPFANLPSLLTARFSAYRTGYLMVWAGDTEAYDALDPWLESGIITPLIAAEFDWTETVAALSFLNGRHKFGKVVVRIE